MFSWRYGWIPYIALGTIEVPSTPTKVSRDQSLVKIYLNKKSIIALSDVADPKFHSLMAIEQKEKKSWYHKNWKTNWCNPLMQEKITKFCKKYMYKEMKHSWNDRFPTGSGKHGKWLKKNGCMKKSWYLKINERSRKNHGILAWDVSKTRIYSLALQIKQKVFHLWTEQSKTIFSFSYSFNYLCHIPIFAFYIALYDKRMVGCYTLNDRGNLTIDYEIIMKKSWNLIPCFLWEPWNELVQYARIKCTRW